jgi:hypothetical protein
MDVVLNHRPSVFDFREPSIFCGPLSDVIPSSPVFERYPFLRKLRPALFGIDLHCELIENPAAGVAIRGDRVNDDPPPCEFLQCLASPTGFETRVVVKGSLPFRPRKRNLKPVCGNLLPARARRIENWRCSFRGSGHDRECNRASDDQLRRAAAAAPGGLIRTDTLTFRHDGLTNGKV